MNTAAALGVFPDRISEELKDRPQWVAWKYVPNPKKPKPDKIPLTHNGYAASVKASKTWGTFDEAMAFYVKWCGKDHSHATKDKDGNPVTLTGPVSGIGIVLTESDPFVGIDLDNCFDERKQPFPWALDIINTVRSYTEFSPSGTGIRLFVKGKLPGMACRVGHIETYQQGRYLTVTGWIASDLDGVECPVDAVVENQAGINAFYEKYIARAQKPATAPRKPQPVSLDDNALIQKAIAAKNGDTFRKLLDGDWSAHPSQSEGDQALCCMLAFWTGNDPNRIDRIFRLSKLYREKWERADYRDKTIARAIESTTETYTERERDTKTGSPANDNVYPEAEAIHRPAWDGQPYGVTTQEPAEDEEAEEESRFLTPPPPVPLEAFPPKVAAALQDISEVFTVPLQMVVACFLALLSCLVGSSRLISLRPDWTESGILWLVVVAASGMGKSPVMRALFDLLKDVQRDETEQWRAAYGDYKEKLADYIKDRQKPKAKREGLQKSTPPRKRKAYIDDATIEAQARLLTDNPKGLMWQSDELSGLMTDMGKYAPKGNAAGTKARLLSAWGGDSWEKTRASDPEGDNDIRHAHVSLFAGIQPGMLPRIFQTGINGEDQASGFLQRILFVRAEREQAATWAHRGLSPDTKSILSRITYNLWAWDVSPAAKDRPIVRGSSEAVGAYAAWWTRTEQEKFQDEERAENLAKMQAYAQRLCLLLHCLDAALAGTDGLSAITEDCMNRALLLVGWLQEHQAQCWQFFDKQKGKRQANPIQRAMMQAIAENTATIQADGGRVASKDLFPWTANRMGMPELAKNRQGQTALGKAAKALGLSPCWKDRGRAYFVSPDNFKESRICVVGVAGVDTLTPARVLVTTPQKSGVVCAASGVVCAGPDNTSTTPDNTSTTPQQHLKLGFLA